MECKTGNFFQANLSLTSIEFYIERIQTKLDMDRNLFYGIYSPIILADIYFSVYMDLQELKGDFENNKDGITKIYNKLKDIAYRKGNFFKKSSN